MTKANFRKSAGLCASALLFAALTAAPRSSFAQTILVSVNGNPITSYDVDQRMKLLKLLKKPSTKQAALDDLIDDKIKLDEISKFTIHLENNDILAQAGQDAQAAKIAPAMFVAELQRAGIDENNWKEHFKTEAEWFLYVRAMNKTLDVSDSAVATALAQRGQKPGLTEYVVRQITIVVPDPSSLDKHVPEANDLRARFNGCDAGVQMARTQPNVVVQALVTRTSANLTDQVRAQLDQTDVGHLTAPERSAEGLQMIAVCSKKEIHDTTAQDAPIRNELIKDRLDQASAALFAPLKARAVIVRFHS